MNTYQTTAPFVSPASVPGMKSSPGTMASAKVNVIDEVDGQTAAVILASLAEECGGSFSVKSIEKSKNIGQPAIPYAAPAAGMGPGTMEKAMVNVVDEVDSQIAAVILAALADICGGSFTVKSIKKSK